MHMMMESSVPAQTTEFHNADMMDSTVTSECGIQAASDTVCRGAQVTPLTRDAGCQYEDAPVPMTSARTPLITPHIIRPSPIKQRAGSTSPPSSQADQAAFMAAKALQQLRQSPTRCSAVLPSPESILQTQIKALQSQSLHENVINKDQPNGELLRGLGEGNDSLMSLFQPGLMNSLPLTSYALLLDMINRQSLNSATNASLLNHINQQLANKQAGRGHNIVSSNSVLKPTPTLLTSGGLCTGGLVSTSLNTSALNSSSLNSNGLRNSGMLTPTTLPSPLLATSSPSATFPHVGGFLNGMNYIRSGSSPPVNIPTMLRHSNGKRGLTDSSVNREVDIESLVDSVIDEHMNNKPDSNSNNLNEHLMGTKNCLYNRSELMNDYEMTPPFKRRRRTVFTEKQLQGLEEAYGKSQYLDRESRLELCKKLSLSLHTVVYWFQNKRAISRRRGQPMENNGANSNSSSIENIHAYTSDNVKSFKTSPSFKRSPPHSPIQFGHYTATSSPIKVGSRPRVSPTLPSLLSSPPAPGLMSSPPSSVMSATLTSAISQNVMSMNQMVGATI
ncbi:uncharacterized protein LOC134811198 [Bolinopsis microptera]|uniref:uncharacterized protein LOC134811198 n=1 Tax=Bolinopsis microptera TaxID=2820187 RepID=UPI00307A5107